MYDYIAWREGAVWTAHCPAIPGAYGLGATETAARRDLESALSDLFEYLEDIGEPLPAALRVRTGTLDV